MDSLRLDTLAGHLVAWHNSHPLARRINVSHVTGLGYVVLPFAPTPATLAAAAQRASAAAAQAAAAEAAADEPIEVLIEAPDLDLSIPAEEAADTPEPTLVLNRADADTEMASDAAAAATAGAPADEAGLQDSSAAPASAAPPDPSDSPGPTDSSDPADLPDAAGLTDPAEPGGLPDPAAPLDLALEDATLVMAATAVQAAEDGDSAAAAASEEPAQAMPDSQSSQEAPDAGPETPASPPTGPPATVADLGEGTTLRERAMARAQQMALEAAQAAAAQAAAAQAAASATVEGVSAAPAAPAAPAASTPAPTAAALAPAATPSPAAAPASAAAPAALPAAPAATASAAAAATTAASKTVADAVATTALHPLFSEDFIPPLAPSQVAAFAASHGTDYASPGKDGLVRVVKADPGMVYPVTEQRWLLTAQIEVGGRRTRVLVGAGAEPAVLGHRLRSTPRMAALAAAPLVLVGAAMAWLLRPGPAPSPQLAAAVRPASSASAASSAAVPGDPAGVVAAASAPALAASVPQAGASAPVDVEPSLGRVELPSLGPIVDERRRATAVVAEATAASAAATAIARTERAVPPPAVVGPAFAVSTRLLRTRFESEQLADAMRELLTGTGPPGLQVQALRSGEDWRVVVWPFLEQAQAEQARALLAARGMKVAVIDF